MNVIYTSQSTKDNLDLIYAQAYLYDRVKKFSCMNFVLSIVAPIVLSIIAAYIKSKGLYPQEKVSAILGLYGLIVLSVNIILGGYLSSEKRKAAIIQEMFDCNVLRIKWNDLKVGKEVSRDDIFRAASYYINHPEKARKRFGDNRWYVNKKYDAPQNVMALLCHGKNFGWDISLRVKLNTVYIIGIITAVISLSFYGVFMEATFNDVLFYIVFTLPLIRYFLVQFIDNRKSINRICKIKDYIDKEISDLKISGLINSEDLNYKVRSIQDEIFSHRASCPLVPNFIHLSMKKNNEIVYNDYFEEQLKLMKFS
ncbi:S-4TM family putative pore-forming effector [Serratia sp. IR-2025]|uniref:S-4TM family putative pore-forming effector n=1 Tax=Serratia nevei TaxID=2703794 RepID=UPI0027D22C42|nr:S-4TM family putative pore-forming effector [Serratia nevei]MDR8478363.1 S-4TM family putative pore-forming effector [Serratia nevei]WMC75702.1 S-4TM family putative pore-forming effector [Serratia nevei]WMC81104.1 S-4TM family putative pore-forming effector [Serratia nevei]